MTKRNGAAALLMPLALAAPLAAGPHGQPSQPSARATLVQLKQGNGRFVAGTAKHPHSEPARVRETGTHGQHPQVVVLTCADSRVAPELVFDQGIGDLFTIRVAGNVANEDEVASVEYAVEHLGVRLCVVLGHTGCGAVTAAVKGEKLPHRFDHLLSPVRVAVARLRKQQPSLRGEALINQAVRENVWGAVSDLLQQDPALRDDVRVGTLEVVGAVYDTRTGAVRWLGRHPRQPALVKTVHPR